MEHSEAVAKQLRTRAGELEDELARVRKALAAVEGKPPRRAGGRRKPARTAKEVEALEQRLRQLEAEPGAYLTEAATVLKRSPRRDRRSKSDGPSNGTA